MRLRGAVAAPVASLQARAAGALANLASNMINKDAIRHEGGIPPLVRPRGKTVHQT